MKIKKDYYCTFLAKVIIFSFSWLGNNKKIGAVSGNTAESNQRKVTMDDDLVKTARSVGINLGD